MTERPEPLEFVLLGPFQVRYDGRALHIGGPQVRAVLARLLVDIGRPVSLSALVDELWGDRAPADASRTVRTYMSRLRTALRNAPDDDDPLITIAPGYQLRINPGTVDAIRFEQLATAGRTALRTGEPHVAHEKLTAALELWHGAALAEFDKFPTLSNEGRRLDRLRLSVLEDRIDADLATGGADRIIGTVEDLVAEHPERERLWGQLMIALYRTGRQSEALDAFRRARTVLIEEYGVDPSPELADIHQRILRHDLDAVPEDRSAVTYAAPTAPAQLPFGVPHFVGRDRELERLDALMTAGLDMTDPDGMAIPVVSGTAGVGKTALTLHWAHRMKAHFPDGQLYADLHGFDPSGSASDPADVVRGFLDALGVPIDRLPADLHAQTGLYRSLLADKRILVVLDNARDAEQVRPLLPGSRGCMAVVTSRDQFTPLIAIEGAQPVVLDLLSADQARDLMIRRLGSERVARDPYAAAEIAARCAGLPLALAVAAARAAVRPDIPLAAIADEMTRTTDSLDVFQGGDTGTDVRSVFFWSYRTLSTDAARLFQLLGIHAGPDVSLDAAASLCGLPTARTRPMLAELAHACLIGENTPGRFTMHDLLRAYAVEKARTDTSGTDLHDARQRCLDHYLHTAHAAALTLHPRGDSVLWPTPPPHTIVVECTDYDSAMDWFATEHRVLLAAVADARAHGFDRYAWQLAWASTSFLHRRNYWRDLAAIQNIALDAARRSADRVGQAYALQALSLTDRGLGRLDEAGSRLLTALDLFEQLEDRYGQIRIHENLAWIVGVQNHHHEALDHGLRALALCESGGLDDEKATTLSDVGWFYAQVGDYDRALDCCRGALDIQQRTDDWYGQAHTWDSLGYIHRQRGDHDQAIDCYEQALDLFRRTGDRYSEAVGLAYLGDTYDDAGDRDAAIRAWQSALEHLERLGHPDADSVRGKLNDSRVRPVPSTG